MRNKIGAMLIFFILLAVISILYRPASDSAIESARSAQAGTIEPASRTVTGSESTRYKVDADKSHFIVRTFSGGLFGALGHDHTIEVRDFTGEAELSPNLEQASLQMTVKSNSLTVIDKENEKDRPQIEHSMRDEVLEVSKYPEIVFKSNNAAITKTPQGEYQVKISGNLTLHGVTRPITIPAQVKLSENGLQAHGEFPLRRSDYKINTPSAGGGTVKVKDELKLSFDVVAHKS